MRFIAFASILIFSSLTLSALTAQGIDFFHGTWAEALEEAQKEDKLLFVDAYAQWCGPCKRMAKNVFTLSEVGDYYNNNFINLKLDMETSDGRTFGSKYPVSAYPTLIFLSPDGEIVVKSTGGKQADGLIELGKKAFMGWDKSADYAEKYEAGDRDFDLMVNYVNELNKVNKPSLKISNDYIKSKPNISDEQMAQFLMAAVTESDSKLFSQLVKLKSAALKNVSQEAFSNKIKGAAMATIAKAVELDFADLVTEAIDNYKSADVGDAKQFELEAQMEYDLLTGDYEGWKGLSEKYLKKYGKKNAELYKRQLGALQREFAHEKDYQDYACDVCKTMVKKDGTTGNYSEYIQLLIKCKKFAEARKVTNEAIDKAKSRDEDVAQFERILDYLDKI